MAIGHIDRATYNIYDAACKKLTATINITRTGLPVRVHSKSFKKRGKTDREPLPYLSVADYQKEKNGIRTEAGDRRREVIARNNERKQRRLRQRIAEREMDWDLSR